MRSAIQLHIRGLRAERLAVPEPATRLSDLVRRHGPTDIYTSVRVAA
jgi:hypothetical protein